MGHNKNTRVKGNFHSSPEQLKNLRKFSDMPKDELVELSRRGHEKAMETRKQNAVFKNAAVWLAEQPAFKSENEAVEALREQFPGLTNAQAMTAAVMKRAIDEGDSKAYTTIRDTTGELPEQTVNMKGDGAMTITIKTLDEGVALPIGEDDGEEENGEGGE